MSIQRLFQEALITYPQATYQRGSVNRRACPCVARIWVFGKISQGHYAQPGPLCEVLQAGLELEVTVLSSCVSLHRVMPLLLPPSAPRKNTGEF